MANKYSRAELQRLIDSGRTLKEIASRYDVSRQRMYQVFGALGLSTLEKRRKSQLQEWDEKQKWFWKIVSHRLTGKNKAEKLTLMDSLEFPEVCPVLGIPLDYSFGKGIRSDNSPSIDQIVPGMGYTPGNTIVISWRANRIKNDGTPTEHLKLYTFYTNLSK